MEQDKGHEIARFPGDHREGVSDRTSAFLPYLFFITVPVTFLVMHYSPKAPAGLDPWVEALAMALVFLICLPLFFAFESIGKAQDNPLIIYSGGIYLKGGYFDRWTHRPDFIPKDMIKEVRVTEHVPSGSGRNQRFLTVIIIRLTNGKYKHFFRQEEQVRDLKAALEKAGLMQRENARKIPVGDQGDPDASFGPRSIDGPDRCGACGAELPSGAAFCGICGRKV